jgi:hypothetical protein
MYYVCSMNENAPEMEVTKNELSLFVLALLFLLALIAIGLPARPEFAYQIGGVLGFAFLVMLSAHQGRRLQLALFLALVFSLAFAAEWANLRFDFLFGKMRLGPDWSGKLNDIPLQQALTWTFVTYLSGMVAYVLSTKTPFLVWAFQALLMTFLITVIDKASFLWLGSLHNLAHVLFGRFVFSMGVSFLFARMVAPDTNVVASRGYFVTVIFFLALAFVMK